MSASNNLPWILLGVGTLGIGAVLVLRKKLPVFAGSPLANALTAGVTPELKAKVSVEIAKSTDPVFLKSLAAGLQKSGDTESALLALKKAADVTGVPQSVQGALSLPTLTIQPSTDGLPKVAMGAPTAYQVVTGDIPGAIARGLVFLYLSSLMRMGPTKRASWRGRLELMKL